MNQNFDSIFWETWQKIIDSCAAIYYSEMATPCSNESGFKNEVNNFSRSVKISIVFKNIFYAVLKMWNFFWVSKRGVMKSSVLKNFFLKLGPLFYSSTQYSTYRHIYSKTFNRSSCWDVSSWRRGPWTSVKGEVEAYLHTS